MEDPKNNGLPYVLTPPKAKADLPLTYSSDAAGCVGFYAHQSLSQVPALLNQRDDEPLGASWRG